MKPKNTKATTKVAKKVYKPWTYAKIQRPKPLVIEPCNIWQTLWQISQFSNSEYSVLLEIDEEVSNVFRVKDWYLPYQEASLGHVHYNNKSAINMVKEIGDRFENFYGVHHLHPWISKTGPEMSAEDVEAMWKWVANAGRGIFIVSDPSGQQQAIYVTKIGNELIQIEADITIDFTIAEESWRDLMKLFTQRVTVYDYRDKEIDAFKNLNSEDAKLLATLNEYEVY